MNIFIRFIIYGKDPGPIRELVDFNQLTVGPEKKRDGYLSRNFPSSYLKSGNSGGINIQHQ